MEVSHVMTPNPEWVEVTETVREALLKLAELDIRHLPVVEDGQLVGMLSDRDLREVMVPMFTSLDSAAASVDSRFERPVSELMQGDVMSIHPSTEISEVIEVMIDHRIGAMPVVDPSTLDLVGIVSYVDVLREAEEYFLEV